MAHEAASLSTDTDSMSSGLTLAIELSKPSTMTSGAELLSVPMPRMRISIPSCPGCPEVCETISPAFMPCKSWAVEVTGRDSASLA